MLLLSWAHFQISRTREFQKNVRHKGFPASGSRLCQAGEATRDNASHRPRVPANSYIKSITIIFTATNKMKVTMQSAMALIVSSGMSRRTRGGNGASAPQAVRSFLLKVGPWQMQLADEFQYNRVSKTIEFQKQ